MRAPLYEINCPGPGRLATMAHPRGGERLDAEIDALVRADVNVLVSAITSHEQQRLVLTGLPAATAAAGIELVTFPILDRGVPDAQEAVALGVRLAAHVRAGRFVVTHCFAGIGRASVLAAVTLIMLGIGPGEALDRVAAARGLPVPNTDEQRHWLFDLACTLQS